MSTISAPLIDSHCHLDMDTYHNDLDNVLARAAQAGVTHVVTIGIDRKSSQQAIVLAKHYPSVFATVGIHPHDAAKATEQDLQCLVRLARQEKVVGYGEIGLDYAKMYAPRDRQIELFHAQLVLAKELNLPVIIHDRDAHEDTLKILRDHAPFPAGGILHCFSGDTAFADKILALGFYISIPGIVTFKNAKELGTVAARIPLDSMLLETDGPFLAPVPFRGKRNEPSYVRYTAEKVSELRDIPFDLLARTTSRNARTIFSLPKLHHE